MSAPRYAQLASRLLARQKARSEDSPPPRAEARENAISAIERAIDRRRVVSLRLRWVGVFAAAAALVLISAGLSARVARLRTERSLASAASPSTKAASEELLIVAHPEGSGARVVGSAGETDLSDGWALRPGSRLVTPATGRATLAFSTGTSVALGEGADMTVVSQGPSERLRLDRGAIDLHVAKQAPAHRFLVDTIDAEVEVRGTQFRVSIVPPDRACGSGTLTRVAVTEGVVVVRTPDAETRVGAGERWPSACAHEALSSGSQVPNASSGTRLGHMAANGVAAGQTAAASSLTDQNDLFAEALAAKRKGDVSGAIGAYERLYTRFPASPLAESAEVERLRLLRDSLSSRARGAAEQYLIRFPGGYAHAEAEAILAASP